jgi:hypothetical protein
VPTSDDVLVVVDLGDDQVEIRDRASLAVIAAVGSYGSGDSQFDSPTHVAMDRNFAYVQDVGNQRVMRRNLLDLTFHAKVTWATLELANAANCLTVNRIQMLLGRAATNRETDLFLFTSPYNAQGQYGTAEAGVMVGLAVDNDYIYVADSAANKVLQYTIGSDAAPAEFVAVPAGYTVAGLAMDATSLYVACNHASNDTKVLILDKAAMTLTTSGDLTAKKVCYAITVDATKLYFTDTGDHSVNWILKTLAGPITSATNLTSPAGIAVLSPVYDDLNNTPRAIVGTAVGGGLAVGSVGEYPVLSQAAVGGGLAVGSIDLSVGPAAAVGGGLAVGTIVAQHEVSGAAIGGGVATGSFEGLPNATGAAIGGGVAAGTLGANLASKTVTGGGLSVGSFVTSGPADRLVVSTDDRDSVATLTDVEAE